MKKVLITGAAGFLGSHLVKRFLDDECEVWGIDDFSTALGPEAPHFLVLMTQLRYTHHWLDICNSQAMSGLISEFKPDVIFNFACPASPPRYQAMPIKTMLTSVVGTHNVLKSAKEIGARVIHASTSEVYGDPEVSPQSEEYRGWVNSYGPRSCYDEGKRAAEALCYDYSNMGVDIRVVRIFNTYGPHMDPEDGRVVSNFICQMLKDEPMTVFGDGSQTRSFCYVDDLIEAIHRVAAADLGRISGPINIGNPNEFTIKELAYKVARALGKRPQITFGAFPVDDPLQRRPNLDKAGLLLDGWEPKVDIDEGLKPTIEWFKRVL